MCFRLWPIWAQQLFWYSFVYTFVAYIATIFVRIGLYLVGFHFGVNFWLFPAYFESFTNPVKILLPVVQISRRPDQFNFGALLFRLTSGSLICYMAYLFASEEKNIEDLKDLGAGLNDLLDYGADFIIGNQLSDGKETEG